MRWALLISLLLAVVGLGLFAYASTLPVYTDPEAPGRLSNELYESPEETRSAEWFSRLWTFETPHKRLSDLGRGLMAAAAGLAAAGGFVSLFLRSARMRSVPAVFAVWVGAWAIRVPLSVWYYGLRQKRFDYPTWADSIMIPIASEAVSCLVGAAISSALLTTLLIRHPLPERLQFVRPSSVWGWVRAVVLAAWMALLVLSVGTGIVDGNEGSAFSCVVAGAVLMVFCAAPEKKPVESAAKAGGAGEKQVEAASGG